MTGIEEARTDKLVLASCTLAQDYRADSFQSSILPAFSLDPLKTKEKKAVPLFAFDFGTKTELLLCRGGCSYVGLY